MIITLEKVSWNPRIIIHVQYKAQEMEARGRDGQISPSLLEMETVIQVSNGESKMDMMMINHSPKIQG